MIKLKSSVIVATVILLACSCEYSAENRAGISKEAFGKTMDGKQISLWTLKNKNGMEMSVTNLGGKVVTLYVPDKDGNMVDVVTGFKSIDKYIESNELYFGAAIGRVGNRIARSEFTIDGQVYKVVANNGPNHLHGGERGLHAVVWDAKQTAKNKLELTYLSKDMEEGYPGNMEIKMTYELTDDNAFAIEYYATTDKKTLCNLTHHSYFNLSGEGSSSILDHELYINANGFTITDGDLIPTGTIAQVDGTPLDFRTPKTIGENIRDDFQALRDGFGYDHNFVIAKKETGVELIAAASSPKTGIKMEVYSDQPGVQLYSGNFMDGREIGKSDKPYKYRSAFCLETQKFPDAPHHPTFPSIELKPGDTYRHTCIYKFSVK
ncbi:MAG TPA: aldose epimerase family protein [Prolixibacteraceae bacterium]|nr:aldose epimerase family protein [Prolixibacteraceae bacterium]